MVRKCRLHTPTLHVILHNAGIKSSRKECKMEEVSQKHNTLGSAWPFFLFQVINPNHYFKFKPSAHDEHLPSTEIMNNVVVSIELYSEQR